MTQELIRLKTSKQSQSRFDKKVWSQPFPEKHGFQIITVKFARTDRNRFMFRYLIAKIERATRKKREKEWGKRSQSPASIIRKGDNCQVVDTIETSIETDEVKERRITNDWTNRMIIRENRTVAFRLLSRCRHEQEFDRNRWRTSV